MPWGTLIVMIGASLVVALFVSWPLLVGKGEADAIADEGEAPVDHLLVQKESVYSAIKELEFDRAMGNLSQEDYQELARRYEDRAVALLQSIDEVSQAEEEEFACEPATPAGAMTGRARLAGPEDAIEREVAALRARRRSKGKSSTSHDLADEIEAEVAALRVRRRSESAVGPGLDSEIEAGVAAMRRAKLAESALESGIPAPVVPSAPKAVCPTCGGVLKDVTAAYCSRCGASLRAKCPACGKTVEPEDAFCSGCGAALGSAANQQQTTVVGGTNA